MPRYLRRTTLPSGALLVAAGVALSVPGGATAAEAKVTMTRKDCLRAVRHQPDADVAYKAGGTFKSGRKMAPADASGSFRMPVPEVFEFNVTRDLS